MRRWLLTCFILAAAGILVSACDAPPELKRPPVAEGVSAADLLPPGRAGSVRVAGAIEGLSRVTADGSRMAAFRFAAGSAATKGFNELTGEIKKRPGMGSSSSVSLMGLTYMKWTAGDATGLIWVSGVWLFQAEAANAARLEQLISSSKAGGTNVAHVSFSDVAPVFEPGVVVTLLVTFAIVIGCFPLASRLMTVRPLPGARVVGREELVKHLFALNNAKLPYVVRDDEKADLVVEWKYADAAWWGILARQRLKKIYRLLLYFDESRHIVYGLDELGTLDWGAGLTSAPQVHFRRSLYRGLVLFRWERGVGYAFKTPFLGGFGKVLDYKFDIRDLKGPVTAAIAQSGWTFRPAYWARHKSSPPPADKRAA